MEDKCKHMNESIRCLCSVLTPQLSRVIKIKSENPFSVQATSGRKSEPGL